MRQHYKWRCRDETLASCTFLLGKFIFCCIFYWQWSLPGMLDLHHTTLSRARELCIEAVICVVVLFPCSCLSQ